ncbi:hypothetical protein BDQ17DRAFT_1419116 [Cyathus striatus]|nr:hypothetical protein BDQ17DRAFT_1419116 [Cyathus striatus]
MASPHSPYPGPGPSSYYQPSPPPHVYANQHTPAPVPSPNPYQYPAYHPPPPQRGRGYRGYNNHHHHNNHNHAHNPNYPPPMQHYPSPLHAPHPQHAQYSKYGYQHQPPPQQDGKYPYSPYSYPYSPSTPNGGYSPSLANATPYSTTGYNAPPPGNYSPAQQYEGYSPVPAPAQQQPYSPIPAHATQYSTSASSSSYPSYPSSSFTSSPNASAFTSSSLTPSAASFTPSPNTSFTPSSNAPSFTPSSNFTPSPNAPSFTPSSFTPSPNAPVFTPSPTAEPYTPPADYTAAGAGTKVEDTYEVQVEVQDEEKQGEVQEEREATPAPRELQFHSGSPLHSPLPVTQVISEQHVEEVQEVQPPAPSPPAEATKPPPPAKVKYMFTGNMGDMVPAPSDPTGAPGIIFSTKARPPEYIVRVAVRSKTLVEEEEVVAEVEGKKVEEEEEKEGKSQNEEEKQKEEKVEEAESTTGPSSADGAVDTPATTVPGSPLSTTTSISKEKEKELSTEDVVSSPDAASSWASLLRPTTTPGAPSSAPTKNTLPTSSVVGFSIPAATPAPVSPSKKAELIQLLTVGPGEPREHEGRIRPRGLVNLGNMCFANAVLQVLVYCPPFVRLFSELGRALGVKSEKEKEGKKSGKEREFVVKEEVAPVTKKNGKGKEREREENDDDWDGESFIPTYVYDAMKEKKRFDNMRGGHQEDAEEFLGFYLDTLEEELLAILHSFQPPAKSKVVEEKEETAPPEEDGWLEVGKKNRTVVTRTIKATESPITRLFGGKFRSTLRAPHQKDSVIVEDWRSLRLDIQKDTIHTIEDALAHISQPQPVQVTHPSRPGVTVEASQQVLIESLPSVLVLHMKRFWYDPAVGGVVKVGKQVRFGPELTIGPGRSHSNHKRITRYKLFGALYHHGHSASGGHYTLDVLHPNRYPSSNPAAKPREGWVRIDDELVSDVRPDDVFGTYDREDRCAYLLFYRRVR